MSCWAHLLAGVRHYLSHASAARATRRTFPPTIFRIVSSEYPVCTIPTVNSGQLVHAKLRVIDGVVTKSSSGHRAANRVRPGGRRGTFRASSSVYWDL